MERARSAFWVMKRIGVAVLVVGLALSALSCGKDGNIFGDVVWDYSYTPGSYFQYSIGGGFPSTNLVYGASYLISPGTWSYMYNIYDGTNYWPGPGSSSVYAGTYTVTADPGSFPMIDGKDKSFELYCSYYGMAKYGSVRSMAPADGSASATTPILGKQTWTQNGLQIEVTTEIVTLSQGDLAKLQKGVKK